MGKYNKKLALTEREMRDVGLSATTQRLLNDAISLEQIEMCKNRTSVGDVITFTDDDQNSINGVVTKKYPHIFFMDNGRNYTWVQYLIGNPTLKKELKNELDLIGERKFYEENDQLYIKERKSFGMEFPRHKYKLDAPIILTNLSPEALDKLRGIHISV